jgi:hypothetical protein
MADVVDQVDHAQQVLTLGYPLVLRERRTHRSRAPVASAGRRRGPDW